MMPSRNAIRAGLLADELAALGPPQLVRVVQVGLAVADVAAADRALPAAPHQLLAGEVAPALVDVALVAALVDHDRLVPLLAPVVGVLRRAVHVDALHAGVRDPRPGLVVERAAVVDGCQVPVRVLLADDLGDALPVLLASSPRAGRTRSRAPTTRSRTRPGDARRSAGRARRRRVRGRRSPSGRRRGRGSGRPRCRARRAARCAARPGGSGRCRSARGRSPPRSTRGRGSPPARSRCRGTTSGRCTCASS